MGVDRRNRLGITSELLVAVDLTKRGYEVFHSMDGKTSCDFVVLRDNLLQRVEVKSKTYVVGQGSREIESMRGAVEILAVVVEEHIHYYPPMD